MLLRNGRTIFQNPGTYIGAVGNQNGNVVKGGFRNRMAGGLSQTFGGYNNGSLSPSSFVLPIKPGAISSFTLSTSEVTPTALLTPGLPISGISSLTISVTNAQLDKIIALVASALASLTTTNASLSAAVGISASSTTQLQTLSAQLGGIFSVSASSSLVLTPTVVLTALAYMEAEAGGPTPLSPEGLASAVWAASIQGNTEPGTMGSLLLASGGGSSPEVIAAAVWDELMNTHNVSGTYGERVQKLLTLSKFIGLK